MAEHTITLDDDLELDLAFVCLKTGQSKTAVLDTAASIHLKAFRKDRIVAEAESIVAAVKDDPALKAGLAAAVAAKAEDIKG
jgi:hypothetical protein